MATEYMYLNGGVSKATLILEHCKTGKIKTKKINNNNITSLTYSTLYWDKIIVVSEYDKEISEAIMAALLKYVEKRYEGKYRLVRYIDVEFEENNYLMADASLKECIRLMTPEQFVNQFGEKVLKEEIAKEFMKWMKKQAENIG